MRKTVISRNSHSRAGVSPAWRRGRGDPGAMGMSAPRPQSAASKALMFADRLKLDKEQKAQTEVILNEALKEIAQLRNQMGQTRARSSTRCSAATNQEEVKKLMEVYRSRRPGDSHRDKGIC